MLAPVALPSEFAGVIARVKLLRQLAQILDSARSSALRLSGHRPEAISVRRLSEVSVRYAQEIALRPRSALSFTGAIGSCSAAVTCTVLPATGSQAVTAADTGVGLAFGSAVSREANLRVAP